MVGTPRDTVQRFVGFIDINFNDDTPSPIWSFTSLRIGPAFYMVRTKLQNRLKLVFQIVWVSKLLFMITFFRVGTSHPFKRHPVLKQIGR
jgi:hypothetical protein